MSKSSNQRNAFIGVPWKGRNFRKAAAEALDQTFYDPEFLADQFNGKSKKQAKSENISTEFLNEVRNTGWQQAGQFIDTGRKSPRFGFDQVQTRKGLVEGYVENPFDSGYDEVYIPDDLGLEALLDGKIDLAPYEGEESDEVYLGENTGERRSIDLDEALEEQVNSYSSSQPIDDGVSMAAMASKDLQNQPVDTVLYSPEFENLSKSITDYIWDDVEVETFQSYAEEQNLDYEEEEELIGSSTEVAGVYIVDTGGTADDLGLNYERIADTYMRKWTAEPENSFKELEKTTA